MRALSLQSLLGYPVLLAGTLFFAPALAESPADTDSKDKAAQEETSSKSCNCSKRKVIGATARIQETSSGASFLARIDTGAETCSLHVNKIIVEDASSRMRRNWGKPVRFSITVKDESGQEQEQWIDSKIHQTVIVKTSQEQERRYKVWLTLQYGDIKKRVHVTLNDRSDMEYSLLIGRNFLCGDFVVDVSEDAND